MQFQLTPAEAGKWYVSLNHAVRRTDGISPLETQPPVMQTRLEGPFNTEAEAKAARETLASELPTHFARLYVWQIPMSN